MRSTRPRTRSRNGQQFTLEGRAGERCPWSITTVSDSVEELTVPLVVERFGPSCRGENPGIQRLNAGARVWVGVTEDARAADMVERDLRARFSLPSRSDPFPRVSGLGSFHSRQIGTRPELEYHRGTLQSRVCYSQGRIQSPRFPPCAPRPTRFTSSRFSRRRGSLSNGFAESFFT